ALQGREHHRVLAILAHDADAVPHRLYLHPDRPRLDAQAACGRQAGTAAGTHLALDLPRPARGADHGDDVRFRRLAWRGMAVHHLRPAARRVPDHQPWLADAQKPLEMVARSRAAIGPACGERAHHLSLRDARTRLLPLGGCAYGYADRRGHDRLERSSVARPFRPY